MSVDNIVEDKIIVVHVVFKRYFIWFQETLRFLEVGTYIPCNNFAKLSETQLFLRLLWFCDKMPLWSPGTFLLRSYNKGSFTPGLDNRIVLYFLVNSKSSIWPLSWVASTTCWFKPNSFRECRNFRVSTLFRFSTWMLKSPVMRNSSDVTTNFVRCWEIPSMNLDTLNERVYMRQTFWIYDSVITRHMRCAQIENSYIIAFPQLFTDLFYLWQLRLLLYDHMIHIICHFFRISYETKQMIHI